MALRQNNVLSQRSGGGSFSDRTPSFGRATSGANLKIRIKAAFDSVDTDGNGVFPNIFPQHFCGRVFTSISVENFDDQKVVPF